MERDMDLARNILLEVENAPWTQRDLRVQLQGYPAVQVSYHVMLLHEAGLVDAMDFSSLSGPDWRPTRLTWAGHEFLEASRDDRRWKEVKTIMAENVKGMIFQVMSALLVDLAKRQAGI